MMKQEKEKKPICGIVMPISMIKYAEIQYSEEHWKNIYELIRDAADEAGFDARMVSHADDANIIQKTIVQNLYDDDIVICDVSAKNSNVMFEFGLRCAFDKPVIVIKDKDTGFSFDTSPFKHIEYSRDLGYKEIKQLQSQLSKCISATHEESKNPGQSPFLKSFGEFVPKKIKKTEIDKSEYILKELQELKSLVSNYGNVRQVRVGNLTRNDLISIRDRGISERLSDVEEFILGKIFEEGGSMNVGHLKQYVKQKVGIPFEMLEVEVRNMIFNGTLNKNGRLSSDDTVISYAGPLA